MLRVRPAHRRALSETECQPDWEWTKREHEYDATGRLVKSGYSQWWEQEEPPEPDTLEHTYDRMTHLQNTDGTNYGERWHWAGTAHEAVEAVRSPNADTASQAGYNESTYYSPQRRTFLSPTSEGDQRHLLGQGKPIAKDSSGSGANWCTGIASDDPLGVVNPMNSRLDFDGTVTATDMDRATDAREKGRIGILGSALAYAGSSPRVTSEKIGRDVNPLGRGDGMAYVGGMVNLGDISPRLPTSKAKRGYGNSINNGAAIGDWSSHDHPDPCCRCVSGWCCIKQAFVERWEPGMPTGPPPDSCCCPRHCGMECVGHEGVVEDCQQYGDMVCLLDDTCRGGCSCGCALNDYGGTSQNWPNCTHSGGASCGCAGAGSGGTLGGGRSSDSPESGSKLIPGECAYPDLVCQTSAQESKVRFDCDCDKYKKKYNCPLPFKWDVCLRRAISTFCQGMSLSTEELLRVLTCLIYGESNWNPRAEGVQNPNMLGLFQINSARWCPEGRCGEAWRKFLEGGPPNLASFFGPGCTQGTCYDKLVECPCYNIACGVAIFCHEMKHAASGNLCGDYMHEQFDALNHPMYTCCVCYRNVNDAPAIGCP